MPVPVEEAVMTEVRIRTRLESDTPHLPELAPLVGREVEIVVRPAPVPAADPPPAPDQDYWERVYQRQAAAQAELAKLPPPAEPEPGYWERLHQIRAAIGPPVVIPGTGDWAAAEQAARELRESGFDFDVYRQMDEEQQRFAEEDYREWLRRQHEPEGDPS